MTGYGVDHVVSRTVRDSAAMLDATGYPESAAPYAPPPKEWAYMEEVGTPPGRLRIAFSSETPRGVDIHPENQAAMEDTAKLLEELGQRARPELAAEAPPVELQDLPARAIAVQEVQEMSLGTPEGGGLARARVQDQEGLGRRARDP